MTFTLRFLGFGLLLCIAHSAQGVTIEYDLNELEGIYTLDPASPYAGFTKKALLDLRDDFVTIQQVNLRISGSQTSDVYYVSLSDGTGHEYWRQYKPRSVFIHPGDIASNPFGSITVPFTANNFVPDTGALPEDLIVKDTTGSEPGSLPFDTNAVDWHFENELIPDASIPSSKQDLWQTLLDEDHQFYFIYPLTIFFGQAEIIHYAQYEITEAVLIIEGTPTPEPASLGILAIGGLALVRRRARSAQDH